MTIERRSFTLRIENRAEESEGGDKTRATGYAAVFNSDSADLGAFIERIKPGAFKRSLGEAGKGDHRIYALWAHDTGQPLGSTGAERSGKLVLTEDEHGLAFDLDVSRMTEAQIAALDEGDLRMSFGFSVREQEWKEHDDGTIERTLVDVDLFEVSFVINPAYPDTSAALRSLDAWKAERAVPAQPQKVSTSERRKAAMLREVNARLSK